LDVAIALVLPKPRANVYSFPDNVCNLNNLPISDEIAVRLFCFSMFTAEATVRDANNII
jgi:hypothetical protein